MKAARRLVLQIVATDRTFDRLQRRRRERWRDPP